MISLRQLQEKCQKQQMTLYISFLDFSKAYDFVSKKGLSQLRMKIGSPPQLMGIITFHYAEYS